MRKRKLLKRTLAIVSIAVGFYFSQASAQSVDALLDKLVEKGILNVREANELREESDRNFTTAMSSKLGMPDWVTALKMNGDFRGRFDSLSIDQPGAAGRTRFRYRLRFGVAAVLADDLEVGFRFGSGEAARGGSGGNPVSGNTTVSDNASKKFLFIDQAYGKWSPLHANGWNGNLKIGKIENPFVFSDIVFDADYTPEGAAIQLSYDFNDNHTISFAGGGFILDEISDDSNDPYMFGAQLRFDSKWLTNKLQSSFGIAALNIVNRDRLNNGAVPNQNVGNTRVVSPLVANDFIPAYDFNPIILDGALTYNLSSFPFYSGTFPIRLAGDYMINPAAPESKDTGWSVGVLVGKSGKRRTWDMSYRYKYLESDAWYEELVDDDTGGFYGVAPLGGSTGFGLGTNIKGHIIKFNYSPYDSVTLGFTYFMFDLIDNPSPNTSGKTTRFFVDANLKF